MNAFEMVLVLCFCCCCNPLRHHIDLLVLVLGNGVVRISELLSQYIVVSLWTNLLIIHGFMK